MTDVDGSGSDRLGPLNWCVNGYDWCPGPDAPDIDGEAWGGKCADCCLWPDLGAYRGRYGWNEAYLSSGGASV